MTREQVLSLKNGDVIQTVIDGRSCFRGEVVEIFAQEVSKYGGHAYVCGYTKFGENARMSFSCCENENHIELVSVL